MGGALGTSQHFWGLGLSLSTQSLDLRQVEPEAPELSPFCALQLYQTFSELEFRYCKIHLCDAYKSVVCTVFIMSCTHHCRLIPETKPFLNSNLFLWTRSSIPRGMKFKSNEGYIIIKVSQALRRPLLLVVSCMSSRARALKATRTVAPFCFQCKKKNYFE